MSKTKTAFPRLVTLTHCKYYLQGYRLAIETKDYLFDGMHYYETNAAHEKTFYACSTIDLNRFRGYESVEYQVWSDLPRPTVLKNFRTMVTSRLLAHVEKFNTLMDEREAPLDFLECSPASSPASPVDAPFPRYHAVLKVIK